MVFDVTHEAIENWWLEDNSLGKDMHNKEMWEGEKFGFASFYSDHLEGLNLLYLKSYLFQFFFNKSKH